MTGLCNRRSGEKRITELLKKKTGGLLCLIDCDKFKSINDNYGHSVGDKVIIAIAEKLQKTCRDSDVVLRLGGDEFAMFIPGMLEQRVAEKFFERFMIVGNKELFIVADKQKGCTYDFKKPNLGFNIRFNLEGV